MIGILAGAALLLAVLMGAALIDSALSGRRSSLAVGLVLAVICLGALTATVTLGIATLLAE